MKGCIHKRSLVSDTASNVSFVHMELCMNKSVFGKGPISIYSCVPLWWYEVEVNLRPTVSWPVYLGVRQPCGTRDQFFFLEIVAGILFCRALSDERTSP
jgi:hypothetical protein